MDLQAMAKKVLESGPTRTLINNNEGVSSRRTRSQYGVDPTIIFIRGDGWSLGAPKHLEGAAYRMWPNEWVAFMRKPEIEAKPISEWY